jgi:hypothetical protein
MDELRVPEFDINTLRHAIDNVAMGYFNKVEVNGVLVYRVKNVIRIDIKCKEV